jgi:hypothetical protein
MADTKSSETISEHPKLSRRGLQRYDTNPSISDALVNTKTGTKKIVNKTGDQLFVTNQKTGEVVAPAGFHQIVEVDKTKFIKLYVEGVRAFAGLSPAGAKAFELVIHRLQEQIGSDLIYLSHLEAEESGIAERTFRRGIAELVKGRFLFEGRADNWFFVNVNYIFNGNRLAFIKEYRIKGSKPVPKDLHTAELPFEESED